MLVEYIVYPFLFAALYFEVFLLLTFLSAPARERRHRVVSTHTPSVAMIVPCWNEEESIVGTVESLLALDYPTDKLSVVVVNDGSTDGSKEALQVFEGHPRVKVIHQENGGKHTALNAGINAADGAELVGCLDADSFVERDALREIISYFDEPKVAAVTVAMSVHEPKSLLESMQNAEYILGIALRHALSVVNGIFVTPGPFSLYRRDIVMRLGGFRHGHQAEDMEMALRLQREGYWIENAIKARVYTNVPRTVPKLVKQRTRWTTGFLRNVIYDYRDLVGNPKYGTLGLLVLPLGFAALAGGTLIFAISFFMFFSQAIKSYLAASGVPLAFTLTPRLSFEWFYLPVTVLTLLAIVAMVGSIIFIMLGKHVSRTPGKVVIGIIGYLLVYAFIAPFWLMRAMYDLLTGTKRAWR
jgi:cellulose synthase/poly-beta-1,6-N-acetylglucosamine synthase-like glycosyltransferase